MKSPGLYRLILTLSWVGCCLFGCPADAYPEFISLGYGSCVTCHFNGSGGGPLTDYGRAVWASEIAARPPWTNKTDEALGESSGFWGAASMGAWKPFAKYRGLNYWLSQGTSKFVQMQADLGMTYGPEDSPWLFSMAGGYVPKPAGAATTRPEENRTLISRDFYLRFQMTENQWIYAGLLDKVFGVKIVDHTSFSRRLAEVTQNDQVHSLLWQRSTEVSDLFVQASFGNLSQAKDLRESGLGTWFETSANPRWRWGGSVFVSRNQYAEKRKLAHFHRVQVGKGHGVLVEMGAGEADPVLPSTVQRYVYGLGEGTIRLVRGVYFISQGEYAKTKLEARQPEYLRWGFGFLYFPIQRVELRANFISSRVLNPESYEADTSATQVQMHFSF